MRVLILFLFALAAFAQPVIIGPLRYDESHSSFTLHWMTDVTATTSIHYGTTSSMGIFRGPLHGTQLLRPHEMFLSGLVAGQQYFYQACSATNDYSNFTLDTNSDTFTIASHGFVNGDLVGMNSGGAELAFYTGTGVYNYGVYKVIKLSDNDFQVALMNDGTNTPINFAGSSVSTRKLGRAACSAMGNTTLAALPAVHPVPPASVTATVPAMPTPSATYTVGVTAGCTGADNAAALDACLTTVSTAGGTNPEIVLQAGQDYPGVHTFPVHNNSGVVTIRTSSSSSLPPEGVRLTDEFDSHLAKITQNRFPLSQWVGSASIHGLACTGVGQYVMANTWATGGVSGISPLFLCNQISGTNGALSAAKTIEAMTTGFVVTATNHGVPQGGLIEFTGFGDTDVDGKAFFADVIDANTIRLHAATGTITACSGTCTGTFTYDASKTPVGQFGGTRPGSCTSGTDYYIVAETTPKKIDWCRNGQWVRFIALNGTQGSTNFGIKFATNAARYRFVGIEISYEKLPIAPTGWDAGDQLQGKINGLIYVGTSNSDITFDRCSIHSHRYPNRMLNSVFIDGTRNGIINSRVYNMVNWGRYPVPGLTGNSAVVITYGSDGYFVNNYLEGRGISLYFQDGDQTAPNGTTIIEQWATVPTNYLIKRNHFQKLEINRAGSEENINDPDCPLCIDDNRHQLEWKRGRQMLVTGCIFEGNWADKVQGASVLFTPVGDTEASRRTGVVSAIDGGAGTITITTDNFDNLPAGASIGLTGTATHNGVYPLVSVNAATNTITVTGLAAGTEATGTATTLGSSVEVADVEISYNTFFRGSVGSLLNGHANQDGPLTKMSRRILFNKNLYYHFNKRRCSDEFTTRKYELPNDARCNSTQLAPFGHIGKGSAETTGGSSYILHNYFGSEDVQMENNTVADIQGTAQSFFMYWHKQYYGGTEGLSLRNNIYVPGAAAAASSDGIANSSDSSTGANAITEAVTGGNYRAGGNAFASPLVGSGTYSGVATVSATTEAAFNFANAGRRDYRLRHDSPFITAGTNYREVGTNREEMDAVQGIIRNVRERLIGTNTATVSFHKPYGERCTVEYGTSSVWGGAGVVRVLDNGTDNVQNVVIGTGGGNDINGNPQSALTTKTAYNYRVLCPGIGDPTTFEHPFGSFVTQ
jgi:hypothetical protein